jgi:molecular chaperone GrpE
MTTKQIEPDVTDDHEHAGAAETTSKSGPDENAEETMERAAEQEDPAHSGNDSDEESDDAASADRQDNISAMSQAELADALMSAKEQISEMKDGFLRAKAEMENIRRRSQKEVVSARKYAIEGFAQELLNVFDSLDQAAQVELAQDSDDAVVKMKEGLGLTLKQMEAVMNKFAVTEVEAGPGVKFNPEHHQAISMIESDQVDSNHIINVMQKGFLLKDRLLRPAMVVVAS